MHSMGLHSALAIKRQRKRREEQKKARERRFSSQSTESGIGESRSSFASNGSLDRRRSQRRMYRRPKAVDSDKVVSSVGMLHIGVVFLVLGLFLLGSGIIPDDFDNMTSNYRWFNELFVSGIGCIVVGLFFIILNKVITRKEEEDLTEYVQKQLTRTKSGNRLIRDVETGCLITKSESVNKADRLLETEHEIGTTPVHHQAPPLKSPPALSVSTPRSDLERILEEEISEKGGDSSSEIIERFSKENAVNSNYTPSHENRGELIKARYYDNIEKCERRIET